jgi:protein TonB
MFDVLLESCATNPRRGGGALVSLVAHVGIVGAVVLGAAREVVCKQEEMKSRLDGRPWACPVTTVKAEPVVWVEKVRPTPTTAGEGHSNRSDGAPPMKSLRPIKIDLSAPIVGGPIVDFDPTNRGSVDTTHWCRRAEDCEITRPERRGGGGTVEPPGITTGSELAARLVGTPARPRYPESLRAAGLGGRVLVQFTVDTTGGVDPQAVRVLESTHELFSRAVLEVLPRYRFIPAEVNGRRVRMVAQMPFEFTISK